MYQKHAPLALRPDGSLFQLQWMWQMLKNCNAEQYAVNKARMVRISEYSRDCLRELRHDTGIHYHERQGGTLQLFSTDAQFTHAAQDIAVLEDAGVPYELLESHQLRLSEPALSAPAHKLTGGLRLPNDETGDCQIFTKKLAQQAEAAGVTFVYDLDVERLIAEGDRIIGVKCGESLMTADRYIVELGSFSTRLLKRLLSLPVYPLKGYSLTIPIADAAKAPASTILNETYKVAVTRFDDHIRVGGIAEIVGFNTRLKNARRETLKMVVADLYPGSGDLASATFWTGLRPMTPDGTPIVGATRFKNLYLNTDHGTLGWTMACGSGQLIADLISGTTPAIPFSDLSIALLQHDRTTFQRYGYGSPLTDSWRIVCATTCSG